MSTTISAEEFTNYTSRQKELNFERSKKEFKIDQEVLRAMPDGTRVESVEASGASAWVHSNLRLHPYPLGWGEYTSEPGMWFYLCDYHDLVDELPEIDSFVSIVAKVHRESMGQEDQYGFDVPTHLANIPNDNSWQSSWETFFANLMVRMFQVEEKAHDRDEELEELKESMLSKVIPRLLRPLETDGRSIKPCLIHSDLLPGNCMPDANTEKTIIFDSCAYWGHNESDLGSWRAPRYRLGKPYLKEYQRVMGISEPRRDWDDRNALYAV
ncbi:MAG: hypothetical protein Q9214_002984, partial [Letrouitia sp. 1 TL-2023]